MVVTDEQREARYGLRPPASQIFIAVGAALAIAVLTFLLWPIIQRTLWPGSDNGNRVLAAVIACIAFIVIGFLVYFVAKRTLWDLLQLLIVPLAIAGIGFWFTTHQDARQQRLEADRARDEASRAYLDQMSQLMTDNNLRDSKPDSEGRTLATARTLTVLNVLDLKRKVHVLRFLYDAGLIEQPNPAITLEGADLRKITLKNRNLTGGSFLAVRDFGIPSIPTGVRTSIGGDNADLSGANLAHANLSYARLCGVDLEGANLSGAQGRVVMGIDYTDVEESKLETLGLLKTRRAMIFRSRRKY